MLQSDLAFVIADAALCSAAIEVRKKLRRSIRVGLCGPQGSGKSTTANRLATQMTGLGLGVAICSLDDFYLTRAERCKLADRIHPLFATRGVPGTHDMRLLEATVAALLAADEHSETAIPKFDKAADDRLSLSSWHHGRADIVLIEGWCMGARPEPEYALAEPINMLEVSEDRSGVWRRHANMRLAGDYADFFATLDLKLMLRAPSFECVLGWRAEQENGLSRTGAGARAPMDHGEMEYFIAHYERITRRLLVDEPADLVVNLDERRTPVGYRIRSDCSSSVISV